MARRIEDLTLDDRTFLTERHLATLTTLRADGSPHVVAVAFTMDFDFGIARVIASDGTQKVVNADRGERAVLCQVDGRRWMSLEGRTTVRRDGAAVADAEQRYADRYRQPRENPLRVVVEIDVDRILGRG